MFKKVVLVGRRQVELPKGPGYDKMVRCVWVAWRVSGCSGVWYGVACVGRGIKWE